MVRQWIFYCNFCFPFHGILQNVLYCRYQLIEDKLKLSKYLSWTFCSCALGRLTLYSLLCWSSFCLIMIYGIIDVKVGQQKKSFEGHKTYTQTILSRKNIEYYRPVFIMFQERGNQILNSIRKLWGILKLIHHIVFS
jgi:hypothetical protein